MIIEKKVWCFKEISNGLGHNCEIALRNKNQIGVKFCVKSKA